MAACHPLHSSKNLVNESQTKFSLDLDLLSKSSIFFLSDNYSLAGYHLAISHPVAKVQLEV